MNQNEIKNVFRTPGLEPNETGYILCPHCNGTGLNDEYKFFNDFQSHFGKSTRAYCLFCYGYKKTDWLEFANGRIDVEMKKHELEHGKMDQSKIMDFLTYIHYGEFHFDNENKNYFYDFELKCWRESTSSEINLNYNDFEYWIQKFLEDGYIVKKGLGHALMEVWVWYQCEDDEYAASFLKGDILNADKLSIEELEIIKIDLKMLGFTIEELNEISCDYESEEKFPRGFKFTWENLLKKFCL